jgi:ribosomal protein S18 acetylase RimI-like enzyme
MSASTPSPAISVRRATHNDAPEILACLAAAFAPYRDFYTPAAFLDTVLTPETLEDRLAIMQVFVGQTGSGEIVGTIACQVISPGEGHLRGMAILPEWQSTGIAAQLLTYTETHLRRENCTRITLDTTAPLGRAMRFYEKCGFRRSGKISDFFGMPLFEYHKALPSTL